MFDTADAADDRVEWGPGDQYALQARSLAVLRTRSVEPPASS
jgi:hypothetical protein